MFTLYGGSGCKYCTMAKELLTRKNIPVQYIDVRNDEAALEFMVENGFKTIPQIYDENNKYIGGYDDLVKYLEAE